MKIDKKAVGARLKRFLLNRFPTMNEAADALGTTADSIRNSYLNGQSVPGALFIAKLKKMGCSIDWLLFGSGDYEQNETTPEFKQYRVEAIVPAGHGDIKDISDWFESEVLDYDPQDHIFLKVDEEFGYSMMPFIQPGDMVLISFKAPVQDNDIVAARWDKGKGAIKLCSIPVNDTNKVALLSFNPIVAPMVFNKRDIRMFKVVLIKKQRKSLRGKR